MTLGEEDLGDDRWGVMLGDEEGLERDRVLTVSLTILDLVLADGPVMLIAGVSSSSLGRLFR